MARRLAPTGDTRRALLDAAAAEFAARGYAGANVDRIARAARVNKAMIYYHFRSKAALYREIIRDMFDAVGSRVRAVAAAETPPEDKIRGFIEAIALRERHDLTSPASGSARLPKGQNTSIPAP